MKLGEDVMKTSANRFERDSAPILAALFLDSEVNEHPFIIRGFAGVKTSEMEPNKGRIIGEFKYFPFGYFMNEHPFKERGPGIMKSEFEDGREDSLADDSLPAVSLGLEMNERSVIFQQLRGPDRAAVPRPGRRLDAISVHIGATGGAR